jgi:type I restriction enzyme S subunit
MNSSVCRKQIEAFCATTAGNIGISAGNLKAVKLPLPRLDEQHRLVSLLDTMQAKVDALKGLQAETGSELEAMLPSVLDRAFSGRL